MGSFLSRFPVRSSSRSRVTWPQKPAQVVVQRRGLPRDTEPEKISLRTLIETRCSSVLTPFKAAWWLFNGHLQTGYAVVGDFSHADLVVYDRKLLRLKDGGTLGVDFTPPAAAGRAFDKTTPVVVALHGLTGGSHEAYVRNIIAPAVAPVEEGGLGYRAVVVNFRGCAGVPLTSPQLYGFSHTDDLRQAILYIAQLYPHAPLLGLGFSLGANILTRYVAEEGESCRLVSACTLACPWDTLKTGKGLEDDWFTRRVYSKSLGTNLKNLVNRHVDSIRQFPDSRFAQALPALMLHKRLTVLQFDSLVSVHSGGSSPPFPFEDVWAYYKYSSSHDKLDAIRIPFLALNSDDDPISQYAPQDYDQNEWFTLVVTRGGGHMGWFQSGGAANRWARQPALEWFRATGEGIRLEPRKVKSIEWRDGWLMEVGNDDLGCQETGD
ncbi:AB-hydrolase YheT [Lactarius hengduanensis]|nr:AB-hydrolase YheT [Lactarius hengduanensis]